MAEVKKIVLVHYAAEQMFDLVNDVNNYPYFLPWCSGVEVKRHDEMGMEAKIHINFKGIRQHFATHNKHQRPTYIEMEFTDGPFKKFTGYWRFKPLREDACKIEFGLHYEFSNMLLEKLIGPVFDHIANTFVESFLKRAEYVFGESKQVLSKADGIEIKKADLS